MKKFKTYIAWMIMFAASAVGFTACQDDIDDPSSAAPEATLKPNTTILELKNQYWDDATNYIDTIGLKDDGSHVIIHGRVITSDEAGNVFKNIVIQDETAALAISINSYNLYLNYRRGQEVVVDVTNMYIGKYNGLQQLGMPEWYANGNAWEASFMAPEFFNNHRELNGWPDLSKIDTLEINTFSELPSTPEGLQKWQSQLVKFNNISFSNGGSDTFSTYHSSGVNQSIVDSQGSTLNVRTSGYSNFWNKTLPSDRGDLVGILSYYGSAWQIVMIDYAGCMNFGNPTEAPGTENKPWSVDDVIANEAAGTVSSGWVTGYIVGAVGPEVTSVTSNNDIEWSSTPVLSNTLVIGQTADTKDIAHALIIELPSGSKLREYGALPANPSNYGKQIWLSGTMDKVMDTYGITGNTGSTSEFKIEGVEITGGTVSDGDGSETSPYSPSQIIAKNPSSASEAVESGVWAHGYIVGWADMSSTYYINSTTAQFSVPATMATNIILGPTADCTDVSQCIGIQLPSGTVRSALNLVDNPGNLGALVAVKGDIMKYSGVAGFKNTSDYKIISGGGDSNNNTTTTVVTSLDENFDASTSLPTGWTQKQVEGTKTWYVTTYNSNNYAAMTGYKGTAPFDSWLISPAIDMSKVSTKTLTFDTQVNGYSSTTTVFEAYVLTTADPSTATKTKLNATMATAPASGYSDWASSGSIDLSSYSGTIYIAFRYYATTDDNYATWCVDNVKLGTAGTDNGNDNNNGDETNTVVDNTKGQFNSFNDATPSSSYISSCTNSTGWTASNVLILSGTTNESASNPYFTFIGGDGVLAPTLNGKTGSQGSLVSPVISGGIKKLTFNYGFAFTETKCQFTINIKDASGNVLKTDTVTLDSITKATVYNYSLAIDGVSGDFVIEIVNNAYSGATTNKDRVSIWNLDWE